MAEKRFRLSAKGRQALAEGDWEHDDDEAALMVEVVARTGDNGITKSNCIRVCNELIEQFGGAAPAITALREGRVDITKQEIN